MRDADERSASHSLSHKNVPPSSSSMLVVARGREDTAGVGLTIKTSRLESSIPGKGAAAHKDSGQVVHTHVPRRRQSSSLRGIARQGTDLPSSMLENFCYTSPIDAGAARSSHRTACRAGPGPRPGWAGLGGAGRGPGRVTAPGNDDTRAKSDYLASQQSCRIDRRRNNTREHGEFFISAAEPRSSLALSSSINYASTTQPTNSRLFYIRTRVHARANYILSPVLSSSRFSPDSLLLL